MFRYVGKAVIMSKKADTIRTNDTHVLINEREQHMGSLLT